MSVYYIGTYDITDPAEFQKYPPVVFSCRSGGKVLASDTSAYLVEGTKHHECDHPVSLPGSGAGPLQRPRLPGGQADQARLDGQRQHGDRGGIRDAGARLTLEAT